MNHLAAGAAGTSALGWMACGEDGPSGGSDAGAGACDPAAAIGTNHGHQMTVSQADIAAGTQQVYSILGTSDHGHSVTVTPANFADLQLGRSVSVGSTSGGSDGHIHEVTITCA